MPLFIPPPPSPIVLTDMFPLANGTASITPGFVFYIGVLVNNVTTISTMRTVLSGAVTGSIDMGIYDDRGTNGFPGTLFGHTGSQTAVTGTFSQPLLVNAVLPPGKYWLALVDTAGDTFSFFNSGASGVGAFARSNAGSITTLPATAGAASATASTFIIEGLVLNGFN